MDENTLEVRAFLERPVHYLGDVFGPEDDVPREVLIHFTDNSMLIMTPEQWDALGRLVLAALKSKM